MANINGTGNIQDELNRCMPAAAHAKLGNLLAEIIQKYNDLASLVAKASYMVSQAGLVIKASGGTLVKAGSAFVALVGGVAVSKAENTDMAALVGTVADGKSALWPFYINASGTLSTGTKSADADTAEKALALLPATPAGLVRVGYIVVSNASGASFTGGTTALDASGITVAYYDDVNPVSSLSIAPLSNR